MDTKRSSFSNPAAETDRAIALVDTGIRGLIRMRVALHGQSNWRRSHIYCLPPEILSLIFQEICTPPLENWEGAGKVNYHAITLASVSSYWRQVALGTAKMWNEMAFGVRAGAMKSAADIFRHHTRHAKNLDFCSCDSRWFGGGDALENILFSDAIARRIVTLRLVGVPLTWGLTRKRWKLPRVHTMYISGAQDAPDGSGHRALDTPSLHRLHVAGESWGSVVVPTTLQTLVLSNTLPATNIDLLSQCPDLNECYNRISHCPDSDPNEEGFSVPYVWDQLKSLTWSINEGLTTLRSVENMKLPALKHLCLLDNDEVHNFDAVITFVHQTSATLTTLELQTLLDFEWEGQLARMFHHNFPNLQTLKFTQSDSDNMSEVIRVLTPTEEEYHRGEVIPFPKLTLLVLDGHDACSKEEAIQFSQALLRMLERRRAGEHVLFQIHLPDLVCWDKWESIWTPEVEEEYERVLGRRKMILFQDSKTWACFGLILYNTLSVADSIQPWF
ncbi:hypothetical protein P691DRAFT_789186 [Macrolepiota fuliginosa MF-IS2]|uniref:F-box domain-containing protein n=1 Tax=Macrolepiota fuliginosa MF-IS2 TaxID=1400762 RepID=A0A9P6BX46_9AGAR|nr:hypothetical protein P691DRAFT_789186 [Macrolepiota fuliginosa MF-IS2]